MRILYDDILLNYLEMYTFRLNKENNSKISFTLYLGGKMKGHRLMLSPLRHPSFIITDYCCCIDFLFKQIYN